MKGNKFLGVILVLILLTGLFLTASNFSTIKAESPEELTKQLENKQAEIRKLEDTLVSTQKESKSLKQQLGIIDGQSKVTELKIDETNLRIEKLKREINDLSTRINRISTSVDSLSSVLLERIVKTYKYGTVSTMDLVFTSQDFGELIERKKYIEIAQANDKKVLYQLQATKSTYNDQKTDKEKRQTEAEKLTQELADYQTQLDEQKKTKEKLLTATQNDEQRYQNLIAQLKADAASITRAISNVGLKIGPVTKGQVIGAEGLSGCTSGPHLHFEVYENAKVDSGKVHGSRVNPRNYIDTGKLGPPMQGYPGNVHVSVEFGEVYALGTHTGMDMYDDGSVGTPILAPADGTAYAISDSGCRVPGFDHGPAKGLVIDHGNGIVTLYWHLL